MGEEPVFAIRSRTENTRKCPCRCREPAIWSHHAMLRQSKTSAKVLLKNFIGSVIWKCFFKRKRIGRFFASHASPCFRAVHSPQPTQPLKSNTTVNAGWRWPPELFPSLIVRCSWNANLLFFQRATRHRSCNLPS